MANTDKPGEQPQNYLENLKNYLGKKMEEEKQAEKTEKMSRYDMENFFNNKIVPVFNKLKHSLTGFNLQTVIYNIYPEFALFTVKDELTSFFFRIEFDNVRRRVKFLYELRYRRATRKKLITISNNELVAVPYKDLGSVTEAFILKHFTQWYTDKDEAIKKDKEDKQL